MIEIYGTANCVYCERAKVLCDDNNLKYVYINFEQATDYPNSKNLDTDFNFTILKSFVEIPK